jgi:hypothetical protein
VEFEEGGGVTSVRVEMSYETPGGAAGELATKLFANPDGQLEEDLRRFKEAVEQGREFSGLDHYMPKREETRPNDVEPRTEAPAGRVGPVRKAVTSVENGTPGGTLGAPTKRELDADKEQFSEKGDDVRGRT